MLIRARQCMRLSQMILRPCLRFSNSNQYNVYDQYMQRTPEQKQAL